MPGWMMTSLVFLLYEPSKYASTFGVIAQRPFSMALMRSVSGTSDTSGDGSKRQPRVVSCGS